MSPWVSLIVLINATNRLAVITRQPGGNHQPGQSDNENSPTWKGTS